jgi:hypothetical protein
MRNDVTHRLEYFVTGDRSRRPLLIEFLEAAQGNLVRIFIGGLAQSLYQRTYQTAALFELLDIRQMCPCKLPLQMLERIVEPVVPLDEPIEFAL